MYSFLAQPFFSVDMLETQRRFLGRLHSIAVLGQDEDTRVVVLAL